MERKKSQMTKKEAFIKIIQTEIFDRTDIYVENYPDEYELAASFWEDFKDGKVKNSGAITENGKKILLFMQENEKAMNNMFTSKEIAEALFTSGRSIAGSMRKLVSDEFVSKEGKDPIRYSLTEAGRSLSLKT
jgi:DNA-binding PadR family transcriptional regulator